jgi:hypothetical protein
MITILGVYNQFSAKDCHCKAKSPISLIFFGENITLDRVPFVDVRLHPKFAIATIATF